MDIGSRSSGRKIPIVENGLRFSFFRKIESHRGMVIETEQNRT